MFRLFGSYLLGAVVVCFVFPRTILFIVPKMFEVTLVMVEPNEFWKLAFRVFLSFTFGYAYTFFKTEKLYGIAISRRFYILVGVLVVALLLVPFGEVLAYKIIDKTGQVYVASLFKLWVTFPIQILVVGLTLKFVFKEKRIRWL